LQDAALAAHNPATPDHMTAGSLGTRGVAVACIAAATALVASASARVRTEHRASADSLESCAACHSSIVERYRRHGMYRSIGGVGTVPASTAKNPVNGNEYTLSRSGESFWLSARFPDGGTRRQRIVGRIGAGNFAVSWVTTESDAASAGSGRVFFAPLETITGVGPKIAPFDLNPRAASLDQGITHACLTCHTLDRAPESPFPPNRLGADAFERVSPLTCATCHGDVRKHLAVMSQPGWSGGDPGIVRLAVLSPPAQRDVCARCHLQGDARIELVKNARPDLPLAAQIPVLVPSRADADFRFVGQLERLALSACFRNSPGMTCTTCHGAHSGVREQGTARFDAACSSCHSVAADHTSLTVEQVTGAQARTRSGCVDCHVRRSVPFDLPNVRTADHFIQRRIAPPQQEVAVRQFAERLGALELYDDGRLASVLQTAGGARWRSGVLGMGLLTMGRFEEAARRFAEFAPPGSARARAGSAPAPLVPLERDASFHAARGYALMAAGSVEAASAAFGDALAIDGAMADVRLARARLALDRGDLASALVDTQAVIEAHPDAEHPWDLRFEIAQRGGRSDLAVAALEASVRRWPANPRAWVALARLLRARGDIDRADDALARARALRPSLVP
jgi:Tfp pilus assembly protein PilF